MKVSTKGKARYSLDDGQEVFGEQAALKQCETEGYSGIWSENHYWWDLMSLLYWDVIFLPIRGVYEPQRYSGVPNVPQMALDMPQDLFNPGFYRLREAQIARKTRQICSSNVAELIKVSYSSNYRKPCRLIENWDKFSMGELLFSTQALFPEQITGICLRILENVSKNRSGLPDLYLAPQGNPLFVEVKTSREKVKENQQAWHDYLSQDVGVPVELFVTKTLEHA